MKKAMITNLVWLRNYLVFKKFDFLSKITSKPFPLDSKADFVISMASYPKRIHLVPAVFEALCYQTKSAKHAYLVLSEEEWPDLKIPIYIQKLVKRGIEIVWVKNNTFAVKVIVPILLKHPDLSIIPLDDDLIYGRRVFENLLKQDQNDTGCIIGHVGKSLHRKGNTLGMMFREIKPATLETPSANIYFLKGSGTLYRPQSLDIRVTDPDAISRIVPGRGADIWLWAAAIAAGSKQVCLGAKNDKHLYLPIPVTEQTKPKDLPSGNTMEDRFQMTIDFFEIREKLLATLPNAE
jgi:hypothetical protein